MTARRLPPVGLILGLALPAVLLRSAGAAEELRVVDTTPGRPPSDAVVLFDGRSTQQFLTTEGKPCHWPVIEGALEVRPGFIVSKLHFRDAQIHVEFQVPDDGKKGGWAGNSGVYIHGMFELQILNSYRNPVDLKETVGAIYGISPPMVNAARPPGQWQVYDIVYLAPRRDAKGKAVEPGSITALLNDVLVQHNAHFTESLSRWNPFRYKKTAYTDQILASILRTGAGPLFLQDHGSPVRFRNVWLRPLDDRAKVFSGQ